MIRVEHVLDSWKSVRQDTIAAVEDFPASEFGFRAAPDVSPFGEIARHILDVGTGVVSLMLAGETDFAVPGVRPKLKDHMPALSKDAGASELAATLRESMDRDVAGLAIRTPEFFAGMVTRFDGQKVTRLEFVQTLKEHELTHRAYLFLCLRLKGITPVTTRRRMAAQNSR